MKSEFVGFFSYSNEDYAISPELYDNMRIRLEAFVNSRLHNASFSIWYDKDDIRTGSHWKSVIKEQIEKTHIFITCVSPKWFESEICRFEFDLFISNEILKSPHGQVASFIIGNALDRSHHFSSEQKNIADKIKGRQFERIDRTAFLSQTQTQRDVFLDRIADNIEGIIERIRNIDQYNYIDESCLSKINLPEDTDKRRFSRAISVEDADPVRGEIRIYRPHVTEQFRRIKAFLEFYRLYTETPVSRIEFMVKRAFIHLRSSNLKINESDRFHKSQRNNNIRYVSKPNSKIAISICIDPRDGDESLPDIPLIADPDDNRFSEIATLSETSSDESLSACVEIQLSCDGIFLVGENKADNFSQSAKSKIEAIATILLNKSGANSENDRVQYSLEISRDE